MKEYRCLTELAMEGLKHDEDGLLESDSLLREEIIDHKLDYLTKVVGEVAQLILNIQSSDVSSSIRKFNEHVNSQCNECDEKIARSIVQYKERKE